MPNRHGTPSGPWPFIDIEDALSTEVAPRRQTHESDAEYPFNNEADNWRRYPHSLFPNWTKSQQKKSGIHDIIEPRWRNQGRHLRSTPRSSACMVYRLNILKEGRFHAKTSREPGWVVRGDTDSINQFWDALTNPAPPDTRTQTFFVDTLNGPVLQMLGTRFTIDPFFFSSSLGWIPCRYQEQFLPGRGDHITLTLMFVLTRPNRVHTSAPTPAPSSYPPSTNTIPQNGDTSYDFSIPSNFFNEQTIIDTDQPLLLQSTNTLLDHDLIGIHAVRRSIDHPSPSTVITYLPPPTQHGTTTADSLHARIMATGRSVYWTELYRVSADATLLVLAQLWYALYAWDEVLEALTTEVVWLEAHTLSTLRIYEAPKPSPSVATTDPIPASSNDAPQAPPPPEHNMDAHERTHAYIHQLHVLRAHLLHYQELLEDFRKTVAFLVDTPHPGIPADLPSQVVVQKECNTLLMDIKRLEATRAMLDERLGNAMNLAFSSVAIEDSKRRQRLSEAALRDSAAMKQIAYITMIYLPASLCAAFLGMNTHEITGDPKMPGSIPIYFAVALPLTTLTVWVMMLLYRSERRQREIEIQEGGVVAPVRAALTKLLYPIRVFIRALSFTPQKKRPKDEAVIMSTRSSVRTTSRRPTVVRSARSSVRSARRLPQDDDDEAQPEVT
ncbi:uncharacterized protein EV420DRAFT_1269095 [Desarmillaria tabescens]|uniref:Cora-domain-containing protein n=1 Tax=Armillaria tabescens TaxID=1929756 RepID=A0AA39KEL3_ARMTA|nr:uncharacterized protein EV420DRAFT_1269095 [Desarmillaria tabescens]KAK0459741.1 hypothetical protein EV420DRAFT_1269095 [Desarmillaria tabescens]